MTDVQSNSAHASVGHALDSRELFPASPSSPDQKNLMRPRSSLTAIAIIAVAASVPLSIWLVMRGTADAVNATGSAAVRFVDALKTLFGEGLSHDEKSFSAHLTSVMGRDGDELLVATRKATIEAHASSSDYLGGTSVALTAPYTAHYVVHLSNWSFASAGGTLFVKQPALMVLQPVSIAVDEMTWSTDEALAHFGRGTRLRDEVLKSIEMEANADAVLNRQQVKAEANKAIEAFIHTWLATRDPALREQLAQRIVFVDELPACPTPPVHIVVSPSHK